jgi:glycine cleavage system aminomethyltransferase T
MLWVNEKKVGRITSSAYSPTLGKNIAIGYIRREFRDFQGELTVDGEQCDDKTLNTVKIMEKPFYKRFE